MTKETESRIVQSACATRTPLTANMERSPGAPQLGKGTPTWAPVRPIRPLGSYSVMHVLEMRSRSHRPGKKWKSRLES
jgi:hypothetical protein